MIVAPLVFEIIVTFVVVVYLLQKYGNLRKHHVLVSTNVFIAWYFAFIIIVILPLDVSSTAYRQCLRDTSSPFPTDVSLVNASNSTEAGPALTKICDVPWSYVSDGVLQSLWRVVYWTAQTLTWIVLPLMQSYSTAGDFTITGKLKTALVENAIYYGSYLLIFGTLLMYVLLQPHSILDRSSLKVICITASNTWGLFLLVLLEGYGLVEIPRRLWNSTKKGYMLNFLYFKASKLSAEKCEAEEKVDDLLEEMGHLSEVTPSSHPTRSHVDMILEKLQNVRKPISHLQRSREENRFSMDGISERGLAKLHKQTIRAIHMYRRTQCQWNMLMKQVFRWEDISQNQNNKDKIFIRSVRSTNSGIKKSIINPKIEWYWYCMIRNWVFKTLSIVLCVFSAFVVWSELTFFIQKPTLTVFAVFISKAKENDNYLAIELISTATLAYLCICAYYSVFRMRILNLYYLAPHHQTNEYSLIFCGMLMCRLTPSLCLNFLGLIHLDSHVTKNSIIEETSYTKIMGHMDVISIISDGFNIYFPILIFFVCLATYFDVCIRVLHFVGFEQFIGDDDLIEEGKELVKREKNRRLKLETSELRRQQINIPVRPARRFVAQDGNSGSFSEDLELLKDVEPFDYTEERRSEEGRNNPESLEESSTWSHIGRPLPGIFDDV